MSQVPLRWHLVVAFFAVFGVATAAQAQPAAATGPDAPEGDAQGADTPPEAPSDEPTLPLDEVEADAVPAPPDAASPAVSPLVPDGEAERMAPHPVSDNVTFIPGKGIRIQSQDGDFSWTTNARLQAMGYFQMPDGNGGASQVGLIVRRARIMFSGNIFGQATKYKIELGFSPSDLAEANPLSTPTPTYSPLMDFYFDFTQVRDANVRVGQGKVPFNRQFVLSAGTLQLADLSLATNEFNLTRDMGVTVHSNDLFGLGKIRYAAGIYSGRGRDAHATNNAHLMYSGRIEFLPFGMFNDYSEADFERSMKPRLSVGAAYAYNDHAAFDRSDFGNVPTDGGTTNIHSFVADTMFKLAGFSFLGEFLVRHGKRNAGPVPPTQAARNGWGLTAQAGYLIPHLPIEFAARYSTVQGTGNTSLTDSGEVGGGVNYYIGRHACKIQLDYFRIWQAAGPMMSANIANGGHRIRLLLSAEL